MEDRYEKRIQINRDKYLGRIFPTRYFGDLKITGYTNNNKVDVTFLNTGYSTTSYLNSILKGRVKDPYHPFVYGVGYFGVGDYTTRDTKGKEVIAYKRWHGMLERCYSSRWLAASKNKNYRGCSVCKEWHNYQVFAAWFSENYIEGFELDKDKKVEGNKVYSPETCMFISKEENVEAASAKKYVLTDPSGRKIEIYNMSKFCRENGNVEISSLRKLALDHIDMYKGWTRCKGEKNG